MPESIGGGSVGVTMPGISESSWNCVTTIRRGLVRYQNFTREGRPARMRPQSGRPGCFEK
jgi:hypothetical protein